MTVAVAVVSATTINGDILWLFCPGKTLVVDVAVADGTAQSKTADLLVVVLQWLVCSLYDVTNFRL
jgi:hypothetical protein